MAMDNLQMEVLKGTSPINGPFSIAMFAYQGVFPDASHVSGSNWQISRSWRILQNDAVPMGDTAGSCTQMQPLATLAVKAKNNSPRS